MSPISNHSLLSPKTSAQWQPRHWDKSRGSEEKGGKKKEERAGRLQQQLALCFGVLQCVLELGLRWMCVHLLFPSLAQRTSLVMEIGVDWLLLCEGQQVAALFLCLQKAAGKREGCVTDSLVLR